MVSGSRWAGNTPLGTRGAQAEQGFGTLVSNQLNLGPSGIEVRAAVTLMVPLGGPVGQAIGLDAAVCVSEEWFSLCSVGDRDGLPKCRCVIPTVPRERTTSYIKASRGDQSCPHPPDGAKFYRHKLYRSPTRLALFPLISTSLCARDSCSLCELLSLHSVQRCIHLAKANYGEKTALVIP